jgi:hypothetical protein
MIFIQYVLPEKRSLLLFARSRCSFWSVAVPLIVILIIYFRHHGNESIHILKNFIIFTTFAKFLFVVHSVSQFKQPMLRYVGESGARRGTEVRRGTPSISARKCCIQLLMPGTNHPFPFLVNIWQNIGNSIQLAVWEWVVVPCVEPNSYRGQPCLSRVRWGHDEVPIIPRMFPVLTHGIFTVV